jgi:hypothetical protein
MQYPVPEQDLHHAENTNDDEFRVKVFWKLFPGLSNSWLNSGICCQINIIVPNIWMASSSRYTMFLGIRRSLFVFIDIGSTNDEKRMQV